MVPSDGNATHLQITQNSQETNSNSLWRVGAGWTGTQAFVELRRTTATGQCLDIENGSTTAGAWVQIYACNGLGAQRFALMQP